MTIRVPNNQCPWVTIRELASTLYPRWVVEKVECVEEGDCVVRNFVHDADGRPLSNAWVVQVRQGWPNYDAPDEIVDHTTDANGRADGVVANGFDPGKGQVGPHWFAIRDNKTGAATEIAQGFGLPLNRHYGYQVTWRYVTQGTEPPSPPSPPPTNDFEKRIAILEAEVNLLASRLDALLIALHHV